MEYSYEEFVEDVQLGREIEFIYHGTMYFVTHDKRGWLLVKTDDKAVQHFENPDDLLENAKINSKSLLVLWKDIELDTVY